MNPLLTVPLGVLAQLAVFGGLYRFTRMGGKTIAVIIAVLSLAIYMPDAIIQAHGGDVMSIHVASYLIVAFFLGLITSHMEKRRAEGAETGFHWAPAAIIGFFGVIIVLDSIFVAIATQGLPDSWTRHVLPTPASEPGQIRSEFPGTVARDFQENQEGYNAYLAQYRRQQTQGWHVRQGWLGNPVAGRATQFQVAVTDRHGKPIAGARVDAVFLRPSNSSDDRPIRLVESAPGVYRADVVLPVPGMWGLLLQIRHGKDLHEVQASTSVTARSRSSGAGASQGAG
ncbi:MAG TPA: FixH family protein [Gammaproteobacteria bacterium]|nr:FixH family protein [Gammaproteobacteria bacterium]